MKKGLQRSRIKGMSFRSGVSTSFRSTTQQKKMPQPTEPLAAFTETGAPAPLLRVDIARLLHDVGRQELHALMCESIEHCSHWRQISRTLQRHAETPMLETHRHQDNDVTTAFSNATNTEAIIESRKNFRLWNHRLIMLEWVAEAQSSMQWEHILKQKNPKR